MNKANIWHQQFGNVKIMDLRKYQSNDIVIHMDLGKHVKLEFCNGCVYTKQCCDVFSTKGNSYTKRFLKLIYFDVNDSMTIRSHSRKKCFVEIIEDFLKKICAPL